MSRRTVKQLAAVFATFAAGSAAFAQAPNPWRGTGAEVAPAPRPKCGPVQVELSFNWVPIDPAAGVVVAAPDGPPVPCCVPGCHPPAPMPAAMPGAMPQRFTVVSGQAEGFAVMLPAPIPTPAAKFGGTWYRETGDVVTAFTFGNDEVKLVVVAGDDGVVTTVTLTGDYAVTKDGTVHGVVTGADVAVGGKAGATAAGAFDLSSEVQALVGQPFAFRGRTCDGELMLSSFRPALRSGVLSAAALGGKYKESATGKVPTPRVVAAPISVVPVQPAGYGSPLPPGYPLPQVAPTTYPAPPACPGTLPAAPPPEVREMMMRNLGGMLAGPDTFPPLPRCLEHYPQYFPPDANFPLPRELAPPTIPYADTVPTTPPAESKPGKKSKKKRKEATADPNVRLQQRLYLSEDLRQLGREWCDFWFSDQPNHLTPERIHGGIQ